MRTAILAAVAALMAGCASVVPSFRPEVAVVRTGYTQRSPPLLLRILPDQVLVPVSVDGQDRWCSTEPVLFEEGLIPQARSMCFVDTTGRGRFDRMIVNSPIQVRNAAYNSVNIPYVLETRR